MRGEITHSKKYKGTYFFITGADGNNYFSCSQLLVDEKQYDKYVWVGNHCSFDAEPAKEEGKSPTAVNVVMDEVLDPDRFRKNALRQEAAENRRLNLARKAKSKKKEDLLNAESVRRRIFEMEHLGYAVQRRFEEEWCNISHDGEIVFFRDLKEAKAKRDEYKKLIPGEPFRVVKAWNVDGLVTMVEKRVKEKEETEDDHTQSE